MSEAVKAMVVERVPIESVRPDPANVRLHPEKNLDAIADSLKAFGQQKPIVVDGRGIIVAGNGTHAAARNLGWTDIDVVRTDLTGPEAIAFAIADNRTAELAEWDQAALAAQIAGLDEDLRIGWDDGDLSDLLADDGSTGDDEDSPEATTLAERFGAPPFTVLNAREGWWQDRKRAWIALGIRSELGRGEDLIGGWADLPARIAGYNEEKKGGEALTLQSLSGRVPDYYKQKTDAEKSVGRKLSNAEFEADYLVIPEGGLSGSGTSVFDPVLTELLIRWFSPAGGSVLDPFAGGSVRGVVTGLLGRAYIGVDLSAQQIDANRDQWNRIVTANPDGPVEETPIAPTWIVGDSREIVPTITESADFVMSCPPYYDLENYSDNPDDLSAMDDDDFLVAYREIIAAAVARLRPNRFAAFVVGDVRDKKGIYRNFVSQTIAAFQDAGASLYNEAILVTPLGSLPIRAAKQFVSGRKMGKTHQNVLVFVKGDPTEATKACGEPTALAEISEQPS